MAKIEDIGTGQADLPEFLHVTCVSAIGSRAMRRPMPAIACPATLSPVILAAQNPRAIGTPACSASFLAQVNEQHAPPARRGTGCHQDAASPVRERAAVYDQAISPVTPRTRALVAAFS